MTTARITEAKRIAMQMTEALIISSLPKAMRQFEPLSDNYVCIYDEIEFFVFIYVVRMPCNFSGFFMHHLCNSLI